MKVKEVEIAEEVIRSDDWWRFACGDVSFIRWQNNLEFNKLASSKMLTNLQANNFLDQVHMTISDDHFWWRFLSQF